MASASLVSLPIDTYLEEIQKSIMRENRLVVTAAPGAGKTTRLPAIFVDCLKKKTIVLEPRRMAAVAAANRIAQERGWTVGKEVGYQVRFESKISEDTKLIFMTEALLQRKLTADPELSDVDLVILDEFHERSLNVDLALGSIKELQELARPDLKLIVMSATLQSRALQDYLQSEAFISVPGKLFELAVTNQKESQLLQTNPDWIKTVVTAIKVTTDSSSTKNSTLVFVPGVGEIERLGREISDWAGSKNIEVLPLHGSLSLEQQIKVLKPSTARKIILATNIAESSVTVDGVDTVIDSGLARIMKLNPKTGFSQLALTRISKASATQRAGRAARQFPGRCFRLWSSHDEKSMPDFEVPEVLRTDLSEALLFLASTGIYEFQNFSWFEKPATYQLLKAKEELESLQAITPDGKLTKLGEKLALRPLPPRLALIMEKAKKNQTALGADICAILQEKDFVLGGGESYHEECDICFRYDLLWDYRNDRRPGQVSMAALRRIDMACQSLRANAPQNQFTHQNVKELLLDVFLDRLGKRRRQNESTGVLASGRGVKLSDKSTVKKSDYFLALQLTDIANASQSSDTLVSWASGFETDFIKKKLNDQTQVIKEISLDSETHRMMATEYKAWRKLPLDEPRKRPATVSEVEESLPLVAKDNFSTILQKNEPLGKWWKRFEYYQDQKNKLGGQVDLISDDQIQSALSQASYGENSLQSLFEKDLIYYVESAMDSELVQDFHSQCPAIFEAPSGKRLEIVYLKGQSPSFEIRLQELFGTTKNPKIFNGQISISIILLAPNFRPVQVTQDLENFWRHTYFEVKKELKSRYPKHYWPDDPLVAEPRQYSKKR
ncbi:MAG: ATP-dependent helicase HrpB [Bdellovibrionota bacterium]